MMLKNDTNKSIYYYLLAAKKVSDAQCKLGNIYENGIIVIILQQQIGTMQKPNTNLDLFIIRMNI